jgi:nitroimidazol reductase NimA-like FMN-containing flavoprotein (pyridoxamine 5'-phosphate oxidase superfamily)
MADTDGTPYAIPFPFCWFDGAIYLRLPLTGRKGNVLSRNDRVCFEVDAFTDTLDDYASVIVEGQLFEVTSVEEKLRVKAVNDAKYNRLRGANRPGHGRATPIDALPVRKIVVTQLSGRRKEAAALTTSRRPTRASLAPSSLPASQYS